jgi:hypothetical protein
LAVQLAPQTVPTHWKAPQLIGPGATQAPSPSQYDTSLNVVPAHVPDAHGVDLPGAGPHWIVLVPSHFAWQAPAPLHCVREPCGSPVTALHVPTLPPTPHDSHCPVQAPSQQTPSTQFPEPHSAAPAHVVPSGLAQVPFLVALQVSPAAQVAAVQQTLSTQLPEPHSAPVAQPVPAVPVLRQVWAWGPESEQK